jgi:tyrosinase
MRLLHAAAAVQLLAAQLVASVPLDSLEPKVQPISIDPAADPLDALTQLQQHVYDTLEQSDKIARRAAKGCSLANTSVRKDW